MDDLSYQKAREAQRRITAQALQATSFRDGLPLDHKKARFPGFRQRTVTYTTGQQVKSGALPMPIDVVMHESVPMKLRDGTTLYSDIFLPARFSDLTAKQERPVPAIVAWSPYGKQDGVTLLDDFPGRAGVPKSWLSGLEKWEGPDPACWCAWEYAIINVDTRGAYTSEGDLLMFGHQEGEDGADFMEWIAGQPWCNGKTALTGNSWLAIAQWRIASLRPKGLAAIAPWEGFADYFRYHICAGGIPFTGFHEDVSKTFASKGKVEDIPAHLKDHQVWNAYWEDKMAHPEWINVPTYVSASWTNPVHTPGTFKAWNLLHDECPKWLRVHNTMEWPDYYNDNTQKDLRRFYDYYLHDKTENGWETTPTVRLSVLHFGLGDREDTLFRPESSFPLARTRHSRYFLNSEGSLSRQYPSEEKVLKYDGKTGNCTFVYQVPEAFESTGYFLAHLVMSTEEHDEMDVFVQIEKLSPTKLPQAVMCIRPQSTAIRFLFKFMHDWQIGMGSAGMALHRGPDGQLRASHALGKDERLSKVAEPFYALKQKIPLRHGEKRVLDIELRPYGIYWEKGDFLKFTVAGKKVIPFPIPGLIQHETDNKGSHIIHCGGWGEDSSYLLVPHV